MNVLHRLILKVGTVGISLDLIVKDLAGCLLVNLLLKFTKVYEIFFILSLLPTIADSAARSNRFINFLN
jgi:hypothetical protein